MGHKDGWDGGGAAERCPQPGELCWPRAPKMPGGCQASPGRGSGRSPLFGGPAACTFGDLPPIAP